MRCAPPHRQAAPAPSRGCRRSTLLLLAALAALIAATPSAVAAADESVMPGCQPGDLGVSAAADCTVTRCAQLSAHGLASQLEATPTTYQGSSGLCCRCSVQGTGSTAPAPAPSPAGAAQQRGAALWTQEDLPAAGPIVDAPAISAAPAPAPAAAVDNDVMVKAVLLLREVRSPMSDAQVGTALGTLGALTKGASWTYRAQQPASPANPLELPPEVEGLPWWAESDPQQLPPEDTQGVLLFVDTELSRVLGAMAAATLVHASEGGQLTRALREAGLQTKAAYVLFAGSGPVSLDTSLLPSTSQAATGSDSSSAAAAQSSGSEGSQDGSSSSLSAGAIAGICICCVAAVAAVAGTALFVRRRRARQGRYEVFEEAQRSGSSPMSLSSGSTAGTAGRPYTAQAW